jgi:hypothetical protein
MNITSKIDSSIATGQTNSLRPQLNVRWGTNTQMLEASSKVTLSSEASRDTADVVRNSDIAENRYSLIGGQFAKGIQGKGFQTPEILEREMARRAEQEKARADIDFRFAFEHQYKTIGQVLLDGKLFAEVDEAGGFTVSQGFSGLSENLPRPLDRLEEIARTLNGSGRVEIKYSNFLPGSGSWSGPKAPESMHEPFTARSRADIDSELFKLWGVEAG